MRILLIEDNIDLADAIRMGLKTFGHTVDLVHSGTEALTSLTTRRADADFDVILLDLGLPGMDGIDLLKAIRKHGTPTPVMILTARDAIEDRVLGLNAGADDYMTKPVDLKELEARTRALKRRSTTEAISTVITHGDIILDPASHSVTKAGETISISRREFSLLQKLMENSGRVISREQLNQSLYGWGESIDSNALEVHVHNIRKRLGNKLIRTIRGVGYMIEKISDPL